MPDQQPLTFDQQELRYAEICLRARGWRITDSRTTDSELVIIATRPKTADTLSTGRARDMT